MQDSTLAPQVMRLNKVLGKLLKALEQLDGEYITERIQMNALIMDMKAIDAEMRAMELDNTDCVQKWTGDDFRALADRYRVIGNELRELVSD